MKNFLPPPKYDGKLNCNKWILIKLSKNIRIKWILIYNYLLVLDQPERPKLRMVEKVPQFHNNIRAPKMQKRIILMRGPEPVHTTLIHKQYGVVATQGGRMKYPHYEMARLSIGRKLDISRMFAVWRIPAPWQPLTKKGIGVRMGHGKGAIDHYAMPIRAGRVILEISGKCEFEEVIAKFYYFTQIICK